MGPGPGTIFLTRKIPVPERCTRHLCLYPCIIWLIIFLTETFKSVILCSCCLFNCFVFFFVYVSHCDVTKHSRLFSFNKHSHSHLYLHHIQGKPWLYTL